MLKFFRNKMNQKGFTLIELIVVIAIIGILAAIAVPKLGAFRGAADKGAALAEARSLVSAVQMYKADKGFDQDPTTDDLKSYVDADKDVYTITYADNSVSSIEIDLDKDGTDDYTWSPGDEVLTDK